ncbi:hypothetical protein KM043_013626 [Ampulex compressa]|nr:hypothetical protein KM043_013626 [Ampulex compressa]
MEISRGPYARSWIVARGRNLPRTTPASACRAFFFVYRVESGGEGDGARNKETSLRAQTLPSGDSQADPPSYPTLRLRSTLFIMTALVYLTEKDPFCGCKLAQVPHIGFLYPPGTRDLVVPGYRAFERWRTEMDRTGKQVQDR